MTVPPAPDAGVEAVYDWLAGYPDREKVGLDLEQIFARAIRQAIDEVIDGARTGRYSYDELETQERAYIGTRIEVVVRTELGLERVKPLDTEIAGHPVDFKWSATGRWMIPDEARNQICVLLSGDEAGGRFSVGVVRAREEDLTKGKNKDSKVQLSAAGRKHIRWLVKCGALPVNLLATLPAPQREAILAVPPGQARIRKFFEIVVGRPVPREVIPTLAVQADPMRRIRQDKSGDGLGGLKILSGHYAASRDAAQALGYGPLSKRDYLAVRATDLAGLDPELQAKLKL